MTDPIAIPLWVFLLLIVVTAVAVLDRVLIPSTRWLIRRRVNRLIDDIGSRLDIEIRPFQLTKRRVLIDRLIYDAEVIEAINRQSRKQGAPRDVLQAKAAAYAREIVPAFNAYVYFRTGYWLAKKVARLLYRVRVGLIDDRNISEIDADSTVVFVMNHRSNMDYILVAFLAAERTTLSYAVGEWARIWPLQTMIRSMGAFFVRRNSNDPLYRKVLERYVHMATKEGVCQAVFPEGGLSRDGRMRKPKYGIIDYMLRSFDPDNDRDIVFIPVGLNYDRTLEDRSLLRALDPTAEKRSIWFVARTTMRLAGKWFLLIITSRWQRFGYACVNFGSYVSMRQYCRQHNVNFSRMPRQQRFEQVKRISDQLLHTIEQLIPVLPLSLVAAVFVRHPQNALSAFDVERLANQLIDEIQARGGPVFTTTRSRGQNLLAALQMLRIRRFVHEKDGKYTADPKSLDVLAYYANSLAHWKTGLTPVDV
jgi:glycerol-3-phosphate O-acyltransferase